MSSVRDRLFGLTSSKASSAARKFFINTLFDSTFTLLGVVSGSAFVANPDLRIILVTLITSSVALGISSGISVYEAEKLEGARMVYELEEAMLVNLENTVHTKTVHLNALVTSIIVFLTPLGSCLIATLPFAASRLGFVGVELAAWISIGSLLTTLMVVGTIMGRGSPGNPVLRGLRMAFFGVIAFLIGFFLDALI